MGYFKPIALALTVASLFSACAGPRHRSTVEHRSEAEVLAPPKTFHFLPDKAVAAAEEAGVSNAPFWHAEVEKAISAKLNKKGYREDPSASTDLIVAFHVIIQHGKETTFLDNYAGYRLSAKEQAEQADIERYLNAPGSKDRRILIVDIIDPTKREVVWREWTQAPIRSSKLTAAQQSKGITAAVKKIFSEFPPK